MGHEALSFAESQLGLKPGSFPFESHFASVGSAELHYVDEGAGPQILMLHGNPTWSILYRGLIESLMGSCRCIAVDLAGFGLSRAPPSFSYLPEDQARLISAFIEKLDLRAATLVAHDWGGPVGLAAMVATEGRITRLCLGNTWAWPVNGDFHFEWFSRLLGSRVGQFLAHRYAVFVNVIMPTSMRRRKLTPEEMALYRAPFKARESRRPMHVFPASITGSRRFLEALENATKGFDGPVRLIWPDADIAFRDKELAHWRRLLPQAEVIRLRNCGHFLWLDAPDECADAVRSFMQCEL
jgi:haloalkane dehalogenase